MCLNVLIFTYYRSKRENVFFILRICVFLRILQKSLWTQESHQNMVYQLLSTSRFERCGGHDALGLICLKWQKFRFQILLRQNVVNYVYVTVYVLKCAYFHLLSLKARKRVFYSQNLWFSQNSAKKSLNSGNSPKHGVSAVVGELLRTVWRPWCPRAYLIEMAKISISNFIAPKCCKLCICNCLCA